MTIDLSALVSAGLLHEGQEVFHIGNEGKITGVIARGGIRVHGALYATPRAAAKAARLSPAEVNGWAYWRVRTSGGVHRLSDLREKLAPADTIISDIEALADNHSNFLDIEIPETASRSDYFQARENLLPLPCLSDGYHSVLLLGTTGAGKTTLLRQLLGTDPLTERFPSTSTSKTTVSDLEIITTADGPYSAVVTFASKAEIEDYLEENIIQAAEAVTKSRSDADIAKRLLDHIDQRFRFSYTLGHGPFVETHTEDEDEDLGIPQINGQDFGDTLPAYDLDDTNEVIAYCVYTIRAFVSEVIASLPTDMAADDEESIDQKLEETIAAAVRESDVLTELQEFLVFELSQRFDGIRVGTFTHDEDGWPTTWSWESDDRTVFIKNLTPFFGNSAVHFGALLTPLVNGIRVRGPFRPAWHDEPIRLVLVDGQGIGHDPKDLIGSGAVSTALSTNLAANLQWVDEVLLVDNAQQPMQSAPIGALKDLVTSGNSRKLHLAFTHFDGVKGDNLKGYVARREHVVDSVNNVLNAIGEDLGHAAERALHKRTDQSIYFLESIHERLMPRTAPRALSAEERHDPEELYEWELRNKRWKTKEAAKERSRQQIDSLLAELEAPIPTHEPGTSRPVYNRDSFTTAIRRAALEYHRQWNGRLGLARDPKFPKEHWGRVKALTRRLATGREDEYRHLKPVADLRSSLDREIYLIVQQPVRWLGGEPNEQEREQILDDLANALAGRLICLAEQRIRDDHKPAWKEAFELSGTGSSAVRAQIISGDVFDRGVPIPAQSSTPETNQLLADVIDAVVNEFDNHGAMLQ